MSINSECDCFYPELTNQTIHRFYSDVYFDAGKESLAFGNIDFHLLKDMVRKTSF